MALTLQAQVLVVGAGPVGLTLAMDLAQRGISVLVAETRQRGEPPNVKCNHVSARSMEIFRRLGVAQALRDAGHHTIAQDKRTSAVYGMPKAAAELDAAREILALDKIAPRLTNMLLRQTWPTNAPT